MRVAKSKNIELIEALLVIEFRAFKFLNQLSVETSYFLLHDFYS